MLNNNFRLIQLIFSRKHKLLTPYYCAFLKNYLFVFILILAHFSHAQNQISFKQLSIEHGLSQNSAISITQDSIGYLWIATQDGLNKYDGNNFTKYPHNFIDITKPNYSQLGKVYTDRQGNIWSIPINKTVLKFNSTKNSFDTFSNINDATTIFQDTYNNYFIGTYSEGLYKYTIETDTTVVVLNMDKTGVIYDIKQDENTLLLATDKGIVNVNILTNELLKIDNKTLTSDKIIHKFSSIAIDKDNTQWFGTFGDGLYFKKENDLYLTRASELDFAFISPDNLNILSLFLDSKNRLWIGTYGKGVYLIDFESKDLKHFKTQKNNPRSIHYNDILSIYEDYTGTIWFGTDGAGLSYYDKYLEKFNSIINFQVPNSIHIDVVRSIAVDKNNTIWIGTSGKGLTKYEPKINSWQTFTTSSHKSGLPSDRIMSLFIDDNGDLLIGTQEGGLSILSNGNFTNYNKNKLSNISTIWDIFKDSKNRYWLATRDNGLIQFTKDKGIVKQFNTKTHPDFSSNNIRVITEDVYGNLWLGTENEGLIKLNVSTGLITPYKKKEKDNNSLSNNNIKSLYYGPNEILWIGTNGGGLNAFDIKTKTFYHYTTDDGLSNNVIYSILPDNNNNLWLSSNKGIIKFTPLSKKTATPSIINYANYDGLATEFNTGAYFKATDGSLYFGGLEGFYWFNPSNLEENIIRNKTTITNFKVLDKSMSLRDSFQLKHNENTLSFEFSGMQFSLPKKNTFQYKLTGYETNWVNAGNKNYVRYTQLPPGDYVFEVKSSNYDGFWNPKPTTLSFSIAPPWYLTTIAKVTYFLLFLTLIYGIYQYFKWRFFMQVKFRLKENEAAKLQELNTFKSNLYIDISHELKTPLTLISGPVEEKLRSGKLSVEATKDYTLIQRNTNRLINLVDQLMQLAKIDQGKRKLLISENNMKLFLLSLAKSFSYQASVKKIKYEINIYDLGQTWYDEDVLEKIVTNLLSNAIKYCPKGGYCEITTKRERNEVIIIVKNTVQNIKEQELEKFYDRFYQKDKFKEGSGIGLALVKELVKLYKGKINCSLENDILIIFKVTLPVEPTYFKANQLKNKPKQNVGQSTLKRQHTPKNLKDKIKNGQLPKMLLVEDHKEMRKFIKDNLKQNYIIYEANNGEEGIEKAIKIVPDIIISDVRMPITDGLALCKTLKSNRNTSHIPIILLTADGSQEEELKALQSGAEDFLTKPFKLEILKERILKLILR